MKRFAALSLTVIMLLGLSACTISQPKNAVSAFELVTPVYPEGIAFSDFDALRANREKNPVSEESTKGINQLLSSPSKLQDLFEGGTQADSESSSWHTHTWVVNYDSIFSLIEIARDYVDKIVKEISALDDIDEEGELKQAL